MSRQRGPVDGARFVIFGTAPWPRTCAISGARYSVASVNQSEKAVPRDCHVKDEKVYDPSVVNIVRACFLQVPACAFYRCQRYGSYPRTNGPREQREPSVENRHHC